MSDDKDASRIFSPLMKEDGDVNVIIETGKTLGLYGSSSLLFCSMIGTGVFITVNDTFGVFESKNILVVVLIWLFGGFVSLIGSLCYAELGGRYPRTGGECVYYEEVLGTKFSALFVIIYVFLVKSITLAALALTSAKYLVNSFEMKDPSYTESATRVISLAVLFLTFMVNCLHKRIVTKFLNIFSFVKFIALGLIIAIGVYSMIKGETQEFKQPLQFQGFNFEKLASALVAICWCFEGWNALGMKAGDVQNPSRNLIASSVIAVFMVCLIYVLCVISYTSVLGYDGVRGAETIALSFARKKMGAAYPVMSVLICLSAIGSTICNLYAMGGVITYAGYKRILPPFFSLIHRSTRVPYFSLFLIILCSSSFVFVKFQVLLGYCSFISWFFYFLSFTCLWIVKLKYQVGTPRTFSINYAFIVIAQLVCLLVVFVCFYNHFIGCLMIAGIMLGIFFIQFIPVELNEKSSLKRFIDNFMSSFSALFRLVPADQADVE